LQCFGDARWAYPACTEALNVGFALLEGGLILGEGREESRWSVFGGSLLGLLMCWGVWRRGGGFICGERVFWSVGWP
jgi:hypothetical protein